jgi:uncharacterized protein DUF4124
MANRASTLFACLLFTTAAAGAETIYKYRHSDGQVTYSNKRIPGLELIETFDVRFPPPAPRAVASARVATPADEARINKRIAALDAAWLAVQEATTALSRAEARLAAGVAPFEEEGVALAGPATPAPPEVGGPQAAAAPAVGGPLPAASPAVGGPIGTRRGGGRNADYHARMAVLEADVVKARADLDVALRRYHELR